jgi:two-component system sensor histidine kinase ChvG
LLSRLWIRLLAFNVLLVFVPAAGFLLLGVYESQLLAAQERSMVQQGRILAAALSGRGDLRDVEAREILRALEGRVTARIRVLDANGELLADSSLLGPGGEAFPIDATTASGAAAPEPEARRDPLYRLGAGLFRAWDRLLGRPTGGGEVDPVGPADLRTIGAVRTALDGRYGASTRLSPGQRSVTLYSAIPIRDEGRVEGVVLVAQSTLRILQDLYDLRLASFQVFLGSVAVAVILSLLVSMTIVRPLARLRREAADLVDRRGRLRGRFHGSRRADEIGELSRALEDVSSRLEGHLRFIESFAADVSHEFKNPLASIRSVAETLDDVEDAEERRRFLRLALAEISRMERLLSGVREITRIDAEMDGEPRQRVELRPLLGSVIAGARLRAPAGVRIEEDLGIEPVEVEAAPERLSQVFENLLDNAVGFSPAGGVVSVRLTAGPEHARVEVEDQGPGVPEEHRDRIFDRFFTFRPGQGRRGDHSGLGLSIARSLVEGHGGSIEVDGSAGEGARFIVRLPR